MSTLRIQTRYPLRHAAFRAVQVRSFSASPALSKERLVIVGSGWGGYEVLRGVDKKRWGEHNPSPFDHFS